MNTLKYKNFIGSVSFDEEDKVFFGKIEGIDALVNYEGTSVEELTQSFHDAVNDYMTFCVEEGIKPQKSYSGAINVHISPDTHRRIAVLADKIGISVNAFIKQALTREVSTMALS